MSLQVHTVAYNLDGASWDGDGVVGFVMQAPTNAYGGAIRIIDAKIVNGAATGAGTSWGIKLQNRGTDGAGTTDISAVVGGTASPFVANTPKPIAITSPVLQAGEWLGVVKSETNSSDPVRATLVIKYLTGR